MTPISQRFAVWACALCLVACSHDVATGRRTPGGDSTRDGGSFGNAGSGVGGAHGQPGSASNALSVEVQDIEKMTIEIVTLACAGDCADLEAVASGGRAPYTFAWDDGSTSAKRHVCLDASTTLHVEATDTASDTPEFKYQAQTASTDVTAQVLACGTDGGATFRDAGSTPLGQCTTHVATNAQCPSRSDGLMNALEGLSLAANTPLTLRVTGNGSFSNQGWHYEIWGSSDGCTLDEKLGAFQLHNGPLDVRTCVSSKQAHAHLVLLYLFASTDGVSLSNWALSSCEGGCGG